jgi:hypothetical protein
MRRLIFAVLVALLLGLGLAQVWSPEPVEQRLLGVQLETVMPQHAAAVQREPLEVQAVMLDMALADEVLATKARLALLRHGDMAREALVTYGADAEFRDVLREHGESVVPAIHYFVHNELFSLTFYRRAGEAAAALRQRWNGEVVQETSAAALTPVERGHYAIRFIAQDGHDFLGQFVIASDGQVARVQTERLTEGVTDFFTSGIRGLETRVRRGEELRLGDAGWAAVDVAIGVSALKVLRMGRGAAAARTATTASPATASLGTSLLRGSRVGAQVARIGGPVALVYIVVRHPSLLNSAFARAAEVLGYPVWLVQSVGWALVLLPLILLLQFLLRPLALVLGGCVTCLRWCDRCLRGRRAPAATF